MNITFHKLKKIVEYILKYQMFTICGLKIFASYCKYNHLINNTMPHTHTKLAIFSYQSYHICTPSLEWQMKPIITTKLPDQTKTLTARMQRSIIRNFLGF